MAVVGRGVQKIREKYPECFAELIKYAMPRALAFAELFESRGPAQAFLDKEITGLKSLIMAVSGSIDEKFFIASDMRDGLMKGLLRALFVGRSISIEGKGILLEYTVDMEGSHTCFVEKESEKSQLWFRCFFDESNLQRKGELPMVKKVIQEKETDEEMTVIANTVWRLLTPDKLRREKELDSASSSRAAYWGP